MIENRKVQYTKKVVKDSFLSLLKDRPMEKITVTEICKLADINRGTFYQHYQDIYDLLNKIELDSYQQLTMLQKQGNQSLREILFSTVSWVYQEREVCRALLGENGDPDFLKKSLLLFKETSFDILMNKENNKRKEFEFIYSYFTSGYLGILQVWIENNFSDSPEEIVDYMEELSLHGLSSYV